MASPSTAITVQSRISAFEALTTQQPSKPSASSPPSILDTPNSPTASASVFSIVPSVPSPSSFRPKSLSPSPSPPILGRKTSLIDLHEWELDDGPASFAQQARMKGSPIYTGLISPPPRTSSKPSQRHVSDSKFSPYVSLSTPLIQLDSSPPKPKVHAPPLPPRKASYSSLKSISGSSSSSLPRSPNATVMSLPPIPLRKKSDSLNVDSYPPPGGKLGIAIPRGHAPASSISSFHSVSLSSDGGTDTGSLSSHVATFPMDREEMEHAENNGRDVDDVSLDSFENVSTVSPSVSSISVDWDNYTYAKRQPPKLPQRPKPPSHPMSPVSGSFNIPHVASPASLAKPPPPPPPPSRSRPPPSSNRSSLASTITSASDRSSVLSVATSRTSISSIRTPTLVPKPTPPSALQQKLARVTPIPSTARARYEAVFVGNVLSRRRYEARTKERDGALSPPPGRKTRQAAGWRGLSVDLITNPEVHALSSPTPSPLQAQEPVDEVVGPEERLSGRVVALIWKSSKLDRTKLKEIWTECDPTGTGSLDRDAFIKGMWRIDEELRRAQIAARTPSLAHLNPTARQTRWRPQNQSLI